ncbi:MAG TPA: MBL fold metallo-hydrolase [Terriglobales bacterium]|nr:MBL fold metallo-hydrolase [Terriglobales bacterium]
MIFEPLFDAESHTWTYLVGDAEAHVGILVDPVRGQIERDLARVRANGLTLTHVVETHIHADHISGSAALAAATGAVPVVFASSKAEYPVLRRVADGEAIRAGARVLTVIHTPGHTPESMSLYMARENRLLTGDSLLIGTCARTDFQSGDPGALYDSIHRRLFTLPDDTHVHPAHDYLGRVCSTIGVEKRTNERAAGRTREEFIALMNGLKIPRPKKMDEAVPANLRLGAES